MLHLASKVELKLFLFTSPINSTDNLQAALCCVIIWMTSRSLCKLKLQLHCKCKLVSVCCVLSSCVLVSLLGLPPMLDMWLTTWDRLWMFVEVEELSVNTGLPVWMYWNIGLKIVILFESCALPRRWAELSWRQQTMFAFHLVLLVFLFIGLKHTLNNAPF